MRFPAWARAELVLDYGEPTALPLTRNLDAYARLVRRTWAALERNGWVSTSGMGDGRLAGTCPACGHGTALIQVVDSPPRLRTEGCDAGCGGETVARMVA